MSTVVVGDATIDVRTGGMGDPIVLLPGGGLDVAYLEPFAECLRRGGLRTIAVNPRGIAGSRGPVDGLKLHDLAADVGAVIEALDAKPAHVVGHGFSNRIVRCLLADRPEAIRSVVLLGGIGDVVTDPKAIAALRTWFRPDATDAECLDAMEYEVGDVANAPHVFRRLNRYPAAGMAQVVADRATPRAEWAAAKASMPLLVVQGLADRLAPMLDERTLRAELGERARLENIPDAGHMLLVERPEAVAAAVLSFLRRE